MNNKKGMLKKIAIILLFSMVACNSNQKSKKDEIAKMKFVVTDSLLGNFVHDSIRNFSIRVPKGIEKTILSSEDEDKLTTAGFKALYFSSKNGTNFMVIDLNKLSDSIFIKYHHQLETTLINNKQLKKVSIDSFYSNEYLFKQFMSLTDSTVYLKLLLSNYKKGHYEIDFSMPINLYNQQSRTIESVLGSIK